MNRWMSAHLCWPMTERLCGRDTRRRVRDLRAGDALTAPRLHALQRAKLQRVLRHAAMHCRYYQDRLEPSPLAAVLSRLDDPHAPASEWLSGLPLLTRGDIRRHRDELVWPAARRRLIPYATGGSSGEPLQFYIDADRAAADQAARWRARAWWGLRPGDVEVLLWGGPVRDEIQDRLRRFRDRCLNQHVLSAFDLSPASMAGYVQRIIRLRPACVYGYAGSLALLARFVIEETGAHIPDLRSRIQAAEARNLRAGSGRLGDPGGGRPGPCNRLCAPPLFNPNLRAVFTTGEVLIDADRDAIAAAFGVPVVQEYGCRDGGLLGCACPGGSLHVPQENVFVEVVDDAGGPLPPGVPGDVIVTHLETFSMPMIRYRTGDVAVLSPDPCRCGRPAQVIREVQGRRTDHIVRREGTSLVRMHALSLIYAIREVPGVRQFRIHQPALDRLEVDLAAGPGFDAASQNRILSGLLERMGPGVQIDIRHRPHLDPLPSGKHVCVTSDVRDLPDERPAVTAAMHEVHDAIGNERSPTPPAASTRS